MKHILNFNATQKARDRVQLNTMKKVKAIQDESGHWYVIPNDLVDDFYKDSEDGSLIDSGEFDDKWSKYRTGGDLNLIQLYAEI